MGIFKCNAGWVFSLVLSVLITVVPRYWELRLESIPPLVSNAPLPSPVEVVEGTIGRNATLVATLVDYNIPANVANEIAELIRPVFDVRKIRFGNLFRLEKEFNGTLRTFEYKIDDERVLKVQREATIYNARVETLEFQHRPVVIAAEIDSSVFGALEDNPKGDLLAMELAEIFGWDVDFNTEIQRGDRIKLITDEYHHAGKFIKHGKIQAAQLLNAGRTYQAFLFNNDYYDAEGKALRRAILRSPLKFTRISSPFSYRRFHPILRTARPHLGVDYAAPEGSPVVAVANGTVTFAGWNGGFGRFVQIRHANELTSSYAHLSRIAAGVRTENPVKQGDLIGAVGSTGLATGPHLDFRMTRNGRPINPLRLRSEPAKPIAANLKDAYLKHIGMMKDRLQPQMAEIAAKSAAPDVK